MGRRCSSSRSDHLRDGNGTAKDSRLHLGRVWRVLVGCRPRWHSGSDQRISDLPFGTTGHSGDHVYAPFSDRTATGILGRRFVPQFPAVQYSGFFLTLSGLVIALWARMHLGQHWSDKVVLKADHQLIRSGPYAYMRHPIYSGVLLGVAGTALVVGEWRAATAFMLLLTNYWIKAKR